ncbi:MAG: ABC transporter substrate-binding protein [Clostridia bacterium]|nr:ABC transporter substrate-binding protein [Clostridia bacterium]
MKRMLLVFLITLSLIVTGAACSSDKSTINQAGSGVNGENSKELFTIRIPTQTSFNEFYIADELGYFKEEGIQTKYIGVLKAGEDIAAALSGSSDLFTGHPNTVVKAVLGGAKIKIVSPGMVDDSKFVHMNYFVKEGGSIKSAKDFLNKKVKVAVSGLNSCTDLIVLEWLSQNNIPKEQVEFVIMPDKEQEQALKQGLVDLAVLHPPWIKKAQLDGGLVSLFTSYDVVKGPEGGSSIRGFSEKFINKHPEQVKGFVRAIIKAHKWINQNQQEAIKIIARKMEIDPEKVSCFVYDSNEYVQESYINRWLDLMIKHGQLEKGRIKAQDIYTNEYNPYYKK